MPGFLVYPHPEHLGAPMDDEVRCVLEQVVLLFMSSVQCARVQADFTAAVSEAAPQNQLIAAATFATSSEDRRVAEGPRRSAAESAAVKSLPHACTSQCLHAEWTIAPEKSNFFQVPGACRDGTPMDAEDCATLREGVVTFMKSLSCVHLQTQFLEAVTAQAPREQLVTAARYAVTSAQKRAPRLLMTFEPVDPASHPITKGMSTRELKLLLPERLSFSGQRTLEDAPIPRAPRRLLSQVILQFLISFQCAEMRANFFAAVDEAPHEHKLAVAANFARANWLFQSEKKRVV